MRNVYLIHKGDSTSVQSLSIRDAEIQIPRELGIRLSSLFMFDTLVFVEGNSDEAVFRELASTLGKNLSEANVGFVTLGGVGNFAHYAAESTLAFLSRRRVHTIFVLDRDERDSEEVSRLEALLRSDAQLHVLERRELENYILIKECIAQLINEKLESGGSAPAVVEPDEVETALTEECEKLRHSAVNRRVVRALCKPAYLNVSGITEAGDDIATKISTELDSLMESVAERKAAIETEVSNSAAEVESRWEKEKLSLVPGSELLDAVCRRFNTRYHRDRDAMRIAELIRPEQIPHELRSLIGRFVSSSS